jgi:hypothetical protein
MAIINKAANTSFGIFGLAAKGSSCTLSSTVVFIRLIRSIIGTDGGNNEDKGKESKNGCVFHDEFFVLQDKHLLFHI